MFRRVIVTFAVALLWSGLGPLGAEAQLDPDNDSMGVYFDATGNSVVTLQSPFVPFNFHLLLVHPTGPTSGYACSLNLVGAPHIILGENMGAGWSDSDGTFSGIRATGIARPAGPVLLLGTWTLMVQSGAPLEFFLGPHPDPSLPRGLPAILRDGQWLTCGISSGDTGLPVAGVNTDWAPVGIEASSFGAVKSLFR